MNFFGFDFLFPFERSTLAWSNCTDFRFPESREFKTARLMDESLDKMFEAIPMTPDFSVIRAKCHLAKVQHFYTRALILLDRFDLTNFY